MTSYSHSHSDHSDTHTTITKNSKRILMEFIVFSKTKENGIYPVNNIILRMMNEEQISELKEPTLIDHLMEELRLPQNPHKTNDELTAFIYLNQNNIDFYKNEITDYTSNETFWFNPEIKLKPITDNCDTTYYNFYRTVFDMLLVI